MEPQDLTIQTNGQIAPKIFVYKVKTDTDAFQFAVLATSSTVAKEGLLKQFPNCMFSYQTTVDKIMQVQG